MKINTVERGYEQEQTVSSLGVLFVEQKKIKVQRRLYEFERGGKRRQLVRTNQRDDDVYDCRWHFSPAGRPSGELQISNRYEMNCSVCSVSWRNRLHPAPPLNSLRILKNIAVEKRRQFFCFCSQLCSVKLLIRFGI